MISKALRFGLVLATICCCLLSTSKAHAYNSLLEIDTNLRLNGGGTTFTSNDCFTTGQILYNLAETNQIVMLQVFSEQGLAQYNAASQGNSNTAANAAIARVAIYGGLNAISGAMTAAQIAFLGVGAEVWVMAQALKAAIALAMASEYAVMTDYCSNAFVVPAHEELNNNLGCLKCSPWGSAGNQYKIGYLHAYGPEDVPYRFHCTCNSTNPQCDASNPNYTSPPPAECNVDGSYCPRGWGGYFNDQLCNQINTSNPNWGWDPSDIDKVRYCYTTAITKGWDVNIARHTYKFCDGISGLGEEYSSSQDCQELSPGDAPGGKRVYYRKDPSSGAVQLCVANLVTFMPIYIGCVTVAPPVETTATDLSLLNYLSDTRCSYFATGRQDLNSLGLALPASDGYQINYSMKAFLQGEFHIFSTITGCVKDLLSVIVVGSKFQTPEGIGPSFMLTIQNSFAPVMYAAIALSLTLFGIGIIMSGQPPKAGEVIMYLVKIGVVVMLTTGTIWYNVPGQGNQSGLYAQLLNVSESIASMFMSVVANYDPIGRCSYRYNGNQLLSDQDIPATKVAPNLVVVNGGQAPANQNLCVPQGNPFPNSAAAAPPSRGPNSAKTVTQNPKACGGSIVPSNPNNDIIYPYEIASVVDPMGCGPDTVTGATCKSLKYLMPNIAANVGGDIYQTDGAFGQGNTCVVRMTVWDMVDCRIANILNMGQCRFTVASMILVWLIPLGLFTHFTITLAAFIILFCLLNITIKFALSFILSLFAITFLVLASPIFSIFLLFKHTSQIFQNWMSYMLGYLVYPGILFAYLALMMTTLNVVMFGDLSDAIAAFEGGSSSSQPSTGSKPVTPDEICLPDTTSEKFINSNPATAAAYQRAANTMYCKTYLQLGMLDPCAGTDLDIMGNFISQQNTALFSTMKINEAYANQISSIIINLAIFAILFNMLASGISSFIANLCGVQGLDFNSETAILDKASATKAATSIGSMWGNAIKSGAEKSYNAMKNLSGFSGGSASLGQGKQDQENNDSSSDNSSSGDGSPGDGSSGGGRT